MALPCTCCTMEDNGRRQETETERGGDDKNRGEEEATETGTDGDEEGRDVAMYEMMFSV